MRLEMLEEAVEVMRTLWQGGQQSHTAATTPSRTPASTTCPTSRRRCSSRASGRRRSSSRPRSATASCTTSPDKDAIDLYRSEGGRGPVHAGTKVCFMDGEDEARKTVHRLWPNEALPGELAQVLPTPTHFEQACELVDARPALAAVGPDLDAHAETLQEYADAGVDELFVQQIGPEQDAFFATWAERDPAAVLALLGRWRPRLARRGLCHQGVRDRGQPERDEHAVAVELVEERRVGHHPALRRGGVRKPGMTGTTPIATAASARRL